METEHFYHMFANGDDAKNFITSESEFKAAFNRFGICQRKTGVKVLSYSVEDSHPHSLLYGTYKDCLQFCKLYESISLRQIVQTRGSKTGVNLHCELVLVDDEQYLMNVGAYTIVQATKDGKAVMPYDYLYGTGSLYFRTKHSVLPWLVDENGEYKQPVLFGDLTARERKKICGLNEKYIPNEWLVCNGFLLPTNYVEVRMFEAIYKTHNCFRAFLCSKKSNDEKILLKMSQARGVEIEDLEARAIVKELCSSILHKSSVRSASTDERIILGQTLRREYRLSHRQISMLVHIPPYELMKYVK